MTPLTPARHAEIEALIDHPLFGELGPLEWQAAALSAIRDLLAELRRVEWQPIETASPLTPQKVWLEAYWPNGALSDRSLPAIRQCYRWWDTGNAEEIWVDIDGEAHTPPTHFREIQEPPDA
jgi:hypothetical protein